MAKTLDEGRKPGSGRRPNPENIARDMAGNSDANISELPSQRKDLLSDAPNYGGIKASARRSTVFNAGSVIFVDSNNEFTEDNSNLFWDDTNNRLGIGTTSPSELLEVSHRVNSEMAEISLDGQTNAGGHPVSQIITKNTVDGVVTAEDATYIKTVADASQGRRYYNMIFGTGSTGTPSDRMTIDYSGNVGIGTTSPGEKLEVAGANQAKILVNDTGGATVGTLLRAVANRGDTDAYDLLSLENSAGTKLIVQGDGNVGIGTTSPDTILDVNGAITQRELSSDPADPDEGSFVTWMSDGTGSGDDGDIMIKITAGGTTKTTTLVDFSAV